MAVAVEMIEKYFIQNASADSASNANTVLRVSKKFRVHDGATAESVLLAFGFAIALRLRGMLLASAIELTGSRLRTTTMP